MTTPTPNLIAVLTATGDYVPGPAPNRTLYHAVGGILGRHGFPYIPPRERSAKAYQQGLKELDYYTGKIDGILGSQTLAAWEAFSRYPVNAAQGATPREREAGTVYGEPGSGQTMITLPYPLRLSWAPETTVRRMSCHRLVAARMGAIFDQTLSYYGAVGVTDLRLDVFGGCLAVRPKRGGRTWSMHSWGIAVDLDPQNNALKWDHTKAAFARAEYQPFWDIVERVGATSLGRTRDMDWQHFQFARL